MEKEFFLLRRNKTEKEKKGYIRGRKIYFFKGKEKQGRTMRQIFGEGKYIFLAKENNTLKEKDENIWRGKIYYFA